MNNPKNEKNDWAQDDDDDWTDDWGDAEDNFEDLQVKATNLKEIEEKQNKNCNKNNDSVADLKLRDTNEHKKAADEEDVSQAKNISSWGNMWKPFGGVVSTVFSTATEGLGKLNQVIGAPDPEELAQINAREEVKLRDTKQEEQIGNIENSEAEKSHEDVTASGPAFGINLVSGVTTLGSKVLNTGLDTLEGIGKKTMTILQENDPLLKNKRKLLGLETDRPNLSDVLKEAKRDADQIENTIKQLQIERTKASLRFEILFENDCGLVHLEALEILSKESTLKLEKLFDSVSGNALKELQETVDEVKELMELEDLEGESDGNYTANELSEKLMEGVQDADLNINFEDIISHWKEMLTWFETKAVDADEEEVFTKGITSLAAACALEMNKLHKIAELLLVKEHHSTANEVDSIVQLCKQFNLHLNGLTNRFASILTAKENEKAKSQINTLFSEMLLATQQIEKAFKLFLPILQIGAA